MGRHIARDKNTIIQIQVKGDTYNKLVALKHDGETFDSVIQTLLEISQDKLYEES